jgi:hypothetical protein
MAILRLLVLSVLLFIEFKTDLSFVFDMHSFAINCTEFVISMEWIIQFYFFQIHCIIDGEETIKFNVLQ